MTDARTVRPRTLVLSAIAGLTGGFLLAIPLSRSLMPESESPPLLPVSNPFSAWSVFDNREILVLGVDEHELDQDATSCPGAFDEQMAMALLEFSLIRMRAHVLAGRPFVLAHPLVATTRAHPWVRHTLDEFSQTGVADIDF